MKSSLRAGLNFEFRYTVPREKTVPFLYAESAEMAQMPEVFATAYLIGLCEWACVQCLLPHLDWPSEQSVGTDVKLSHLAATPPGLTVTVQVKLEAVEGRKLRFAVRAHDGVDTITEGSHERFVIDAAKFNARVAAKAASANR